MEKAMSTYKYAAIDPMSLFLSDRAYLIWVELHHPHEPALSKVAEVVKTLSPEEKKFALSQAKKLAAYSKAVTESLSK